MTNKNIEEQENVTFDEFRAWLSGLIVGKRGALPDVDDWRKIKNMLDRVHPETITVTEPQYVPPYVPPYISPNPPPFCPAPIIWNDSMNDNTTPIWNDTMNDKISFSLDSNPNTYPDGIDTVITSDLSSIIDTLIAAQDEVK